MFIRVLIYLLFIVSVGFTSGCSDEFFGCATRVSLPDIAPNSERLIISTARDCGAASTPSFSTYIMLERDYNETDNFDIETAKKNIIFTRRQGIIITRWISDDYIEVLYDFTPEFGRTGRFVKQKHKVKGIKITYTEFDYREFDKEALKN